MCELWKQNQKRVIKNSQLPLISFSRHVPTACGNHQVKQAMIA
jgi:hypothetical protein